VPRSESNNHKIGRQGEFLAAYILETHGVEVHHVDRQDADLWCRVGNRLTTVQVKTSSGAKLRSQGAVTPVYNFCTPPISVDWYCFLSLAHGLLLMRPANAVVQKYTTIRHPEFTEENQRKTIEDFIKSC